MKALRRAILVVLALLPACGGVRDTLHDRPVSTADAFEARELVDVLPYGRIPAIERPRFESPAKAADWLGGSAPVVVLTVGADARAYPLAILLWHEVVDDIVGGTPVVVTYSPLTGAAAAFDRRVLAETLTFRVSGKLYRSGLVMADRRTRSLWLQSTGKAVAGAAKGIGMARIAAQVVPFAAFRTSFPNGIVLSRDTGSIRAYGLNPYAGYLGRKRPFPSFFAPRPDGRLRPMERVVGIPSLVGSRTYLVATVRRSRVLVDRVGNVETVVFWQRGMRSPLDTAVLGRGRDVGATGVFTPAVGGRHLDFEAAGSGFRDRQTGSSWTLLGVATSGPLKGQRLEPVVHVDGFWFAWAASQYTSVFGS